IEPRLQIRAVIGRAPQATVVEADIEDGRFARYRGQRASPTGPVGADRAPAQRAAEIRSLGDGAPRKEREETQSNDRGSHTRSMHPLESLRLLAQSLWLTRIRSVRRRRRLRRRRAGAVILRRRDILRVLGRGRGALTDRCGAFWRALVSGRRRDQ